MGTKRGAVSTRSLSTAVALLLLIALLITFALLLALVLRVRFERSPVIDAGPAILTISSDTESGAGFSLTSSDSVATAHEWNQDAATATPNPLAAKSIAARNQPRPTWTATPVPTNTPTPSPTPNPTFVSSAYGLGDSMPDGIAHGERWIDVNLTEQKLVAFEGFVPVFEELVSTGTTNHPTVAGQFRIWLRFQSQDMDGYRLGYDYYLRDVPYVQYFYEDYALHGTFWHSNFGRPMSHGCVNLSPSAAEWLFNWAGYGTLVNIHP